MSRLGSMKCIWHCCFEWDWYVIAMASLCVVCLRSIVIYTAKSALNAVPMLTQDQLIFFLEMRVCFPNETQRNSEYSWLLTTTTLLTLTPLRRKKTGAHTEAEEEDTAIWMPCRQCGTCPRNPVSLDLDLYLDNKNCDEGSCMCSYYLHVWAMLQPCSLVSLQELRQLRQPLNCKVRIKNALDLLFTVLLYLGHFHVFPMLICTSFP